MALFLLQARNPMVVLATAAAAVAVKTLSWDAESIRLAQCIIAEWLEGRPVLAADPSYAPCTSGVRCTAGHLVAGNICHKPFD